VDGLSFLRLSDVLSCGRNAFKVLYGPLQGGDSELEDVKVEISIPRGALVLLENWSRLVKVDVAVMLRRILVDGIRAHFENVDGPWLHDDHLNEGDALLAEYGYRNRGDWGLDC